MSAIVGAPCSGASTSKSIKSFIHLEFAKNVSLKFFFLSFYGKLNTVCQSLVLALKQALDVKSSPGSRGGCPLVNLSSPRHTVEPRRPLLIYTLRGMIGRRPGRQPLLRVWTTSQLGGLAEEGAPLETVQGGGNTSQQSLLHSTRQ